MEIQATYPGLEVVNVGQPGGTPPVILEQLERFAAQVMPAFKSPVAGGRTAAPASAWLPDHGSHRHGGPRAG